MDGNILQSGCTLLFVVVTYIFIIGLVMMFLSKKKTDNFVSPSFVDSHQGTDLPQIKIPLYTDKGVGVEPGVVTYAGPGVAVEGKHKPLVGKFIPTHEPNTQEPPLGAMDSYAGPWSGYNGCIGNPNGVNKMSYKNPYGNTAPYGEQMYGYCEEGINNTFDKNPYETNF